MISVKLSLLKLSVKTKKLYCLCIYMTLDSDGKLFKNEYKNAIKTDLVSEKLHFVTGGININSLDYVFSNTEKTFFNTLFKKSIFLLITKPTRVTWHSSTGIDHILKNVKLNKSIFQAIVKTDIPDHFPIFLRKQFLNQK